MFRSGFAICFLLLFALQLSSQSRSAGCGFVFAIPSQPFYNPGVTVSIFASSDAVVLIQLLSLGIDTTLYIDSMARKTIILPEAITLSENGKMESSSVLITSNSNIMVTVGSFQSYSSDAFELKPIKHLGRSYTVQSWKRLYEGFFLLAATQDNTNISMTSNTSATGGLPVDTTIAINLNRGDTYLFTSVFKLSGVRIESDKAIAAFGGNLCAISKNFCDACDYVIDQLLPDSLQGLTYIVPRTPERNQDHVQVVGLEDETVISVADSLYDTIQRGESIQLFIDEATFLSSSKPISVMKMLISQECDDSFGDPAMLTIPPLNFSPGTAYLRTFKLASPVTNSLNLLVQAEGHLDTRINGIPLSPGVFSLVPHSTDWYAADVVLTDSIVEVSCPSPFVVYVYGLGNVESYAYKAGVLDHFSTGSTGMGGTVQQSGFCPGDSVTLALSESYDTYLWSTGSTSSTLTTNQPGIYWVNLAKDIECTLLRDSFIVELFELPESGPLIADPICPALGETAFFSVADSYPIVAWSNGSDSSSAIYAETGEAWVTLQNSFGCTDTFFFTVEEYCNLIDTLPPSTTLDIPNAFSPNGDGVNDVFIPLFTPATQILTYSFEIYSRWGELIFQTNQPDQGWDGTFLGKEMPLGSYLYVVKFSTEEATNQIQHGVVQLVR